MQFDSKQAEWLAKRLENHGTTHYDDCPCKEAAMLRAAVERVHELEKVNAVLADQLATWHDMKPDLTRLFAAEKVVKAARTHIANGCLGWLDLDQALKEYDDAV